MLYRPTNQRQANYAGTSYLAFLNQIKQVCSVDRFSLSSVSYEDFCKKQHERLTEQLADKETGSVIEFQVVNKNVPILHIVSKFRGEVVYAESFDITEIG